MSTPTSTTSQSTGVFASTGSSLTAVLGTVTTAATTVSSVINSVGYLAASGEIKAKYFHARVESKAQKEDFLLRTLDEIQTLDRLSQLQKEIAAKMQDPAYAMLYAQAKADLDAYLAKP
jgi:hypothetical protein